LARAIERPACVPTEFSEISAAFSSARYSRCYRAGILPLAAAFIIHKEEGLVLADWSTHRGAEVVVTQAGKRAVRWVEPVVGIEHAVAEKLVDAAVELVRAGLGYFVHHGVAAVSELGAEIILFYFEFLYSIGRRPIQRNLNAGILLVSGSAGPVHENIRSSISSPIGDEAFAVHSPAKEP